MKRLLTVLLLMLGVSSFSTKAQSDMVAVSPYVDSIWTIDTLSWMVTSRFELTLPGSTVTGCNGLVSEGGILYGIVKVTGVTGRLFCSIDPGAGAVTVIGNTGDNVAGIAPYNSTTMVAVTGDGATVTETMHFLDIATGALTVMGPSTTVGSDGEATAYCPENNKHYRWSGRDTNPAMEAWDPVTGTAISVTRSGFNYDEVQSATYVGNGTFLLANLDQEFVYVDTTGFAKNPNPIGIGTIMGNYIKGMAFHTQCQPVAAVANSTDTLVCDGDTITLTGSGSLGTYTWDNGAADGVAFVPTAGVTTFTLTVDSAGCTAQDTVQVVVNSLPAVGAAADAPDYCLGDLTTLTGSGADTYLWDNGVTDNVGFVAPVGSTTYTVVGTDLNGCSNVMTVDVVVNDLPTVVGSADMPMYCDGDLTTLTGTGAPTLSWDNSVTDGVPFSQAVGSTDYIVTGTDANGCMNTDTVTVVVNALPTVTAIADQNGYCDGDMITLNGGGADSYSWDNSVLDGVAFAQALGTITYMVTGTDLNGCMNISTIDVTVNPNPTGSLVATDELLGNDGTITTTVSGGTGPFTYDWDNDGTGDFDDPQNLTGLATGTYTVVIMDANGCTTTETIFVDTQVGIANFGQDAFMKIYPNPSNGIFQIELVNMDVSGTRLQIIDIEGREVFNSGFNSTVLDINISNMANGLYTVLITNETHRSVQRIEIAQ